MIFFSLPNFSIRQVLSKTFCEQCPSVCVFYNCFFPLGENTIEYFESKIEEIENNKPTKLVGYDNPNIYYSLITLWKQVSDDYKKYNQLKCITMNNVDSTLHPTAEGNRVWSDRLYELILSI